MHLLNRSEILYSTLKNIFRSIFLVFLFLGFLILAGCGGGGGGDPGNGVGNDPIEVEINSDIDVFLAAISKQDLPQAMEHVDSNLQYFRAGSSSVQGFSYFRALLSLFLEGATSINIELRDRGVTPDGENSAIVRGTLVYNYRDASKVYKEMSETCEIKYERVSRWGILSFSRFSLGGLSFPPNP